MSERDSVATDAEFYDRILGNPIHAYKMMKRFSVDLKRIEAEMKKDDWTSEDKACSRLLEVGGGRNYITAILYDAYSLLLCFYPKTILLGRDKYEFTLPNMLEIRSQSVCARPTFCKFITIMAYLAKK